MAEPKMDEIPLELRDSPWDHANFYMTMTIIGVNWITFFAYLLVRSFKKQRDVYGKKKIPSKADRPLYICGLIFAATNWLLGTLFTTGTVTLRPDLDVASLPATMIYFVQYLTGALLWLWLTVDRMLARYASVRFAGEAKWKQGLLLRVSACLLAFVPFLVVAIIAVAMDKVEINPMGVTDQDDTFEIIMVLYHGLLALGIGFLVFKIRKIIGNFHELIRYSIFVGLTLLFFLNDALTTLIHPLQKEVVAQQCLLLLVWLVTTGCILWILILAMKPRKDAEKEVEMTDGPAGEAETVRPKLTDAQAINQFIDEDSCGANEPPETAIFDKTKDILWYGVPRLRLAKQEKPPHLLAFVQQLPDELVEGVDTDTGYFAQTVQLRPIRYRPLLGFLGELRTIR